MTVCRNCGRGYEHEDGIDFVCNVCGAENEVDGSVSYAGSREDVDEMEERIAEYDRRDER